MTSRRDFLKKGFAGIAAVPAIHYNPTIKYSLTDLVDTQKNGDEYWRLVRKQFPLKEDQTYFNNGTMGPPPGYVLDRMFHHLQYYAIHGAEIDYKDGSGPELLSGYFKYESLRKKIAKIINADYKEVSLTQNATFGMNYVAHGLDLKAGDELLNTDQEHGGGFAAWQLLAKRKGCVYKQAKMPVPANDPQEIYDAIFNEVTKKTKVIAIPHIVSVYGTVMPVKAICAEARKRGIFTVLDGAQCVGQIPVDVKDIGCDAYYSSLHKWLLAPAGNGILYISPDVVENIWTTVASYNWDHTEDHGFRMMQTGTGNPGLIEGLDAAVDFYNTIGAERWFNRIKELGSHLREGLQAHDFVKIHSSTNPSMAAGITTYAVDGQTGPELQKILWSQERLQPRSVGSELLRHSVHIYNSKEEIDRGLAVVASLG
jgi:selenocysteine lyase/cysteine desulfurase